LHTGVVNMIVPVHGVVIMKVPVHGVVLANVSWYNKRNYGIGFSGL